MSLEPVEQASGFEVCNVGRVKVKTAHDHAQMGAQRKRQKWPAIPATEQHGRPLRPEGWIVPWHGAVLAQATPALGGPGLNVVAQVGRVGTGDVSDTGALDLLPEGALWSRETGREGDQPRKANVSGENDAARVGRLCAQMLQRCRPGALAIPHQLHRGHPVGVLFCYQPRRLPDEVERL